MSMQMQIEEEAWTVAGGYGLPDGDQASEVALMSIAISMRRIADEVCGSPERLSLVNGIMHAIEQGIFSAANRG